ncbi:MAG: hypothetical protein JSR96_04210 [Proteobacteria bacterium]|nr:hypothetical protein [Pseudomonadota bacterium]
MAETKYASALTITDGRLAGRDGVTAKGLQVSASAANSLTIQSAQSSYNGVIVAGGRSAYTLTDSKIRLAGPGSNDFLGIGAGVMVRDSAALVLNHVDIETSARAASAAVAAENSTLRIYDSRLVANGGPLPADYKPHIGPGMLEPPAPLGLKGTARTVLAMSNSRTYLYNSQIEAAGWGALSTDATGGNLYLEANDCIVKVTGRGYGAYADFGAKVVLNRTRVDSGAYQGIIAGAAEIQFNAASGRAADSSVMIHSVMAFDPTEQGRLSVKDSKLSSGGPVFLVKSANAAINVEASELASDAGTLLEVRKNDDPNATQTRGAVVPGVHLALSKGTYRGNVTDTDPDRPTELMLSGAQFSGQLSDVRFSADPDSRWTASGNSRVALVPGTGLDTIIVPTGAYVTIISNDPGLATGIRTAAQGGTIEIVRK